MDFTYTTNCSGVDGYVTITSITGGQDQYSTDGSTCFNYNGSPVTVGPFSNGTNPTIYVRTDQGGYTSKNTGVVNCTTTTTIPPTTTTTTTVAIYAYFVNASQDNGYTNSSSTCNGPGATNTIYSTHDSVNDITNGDTLWANSNRTTVWNGNLE